MESKNRKLKHPLKKNGDSMEPLPCHDCVNVHGDNPSEWLEQWPLGAEHRKKYGEHLCDGCYDEREENGW